MWPFKRVELSDLFKKNVRLFKKNGWHQKGKIYLNHNLKYELLSREDKDTIFSMFIEKGCLTHILFNTYLYSGKTQEFSFYHRKDKSSGAPSYMYEERSEFLKTGKIP